MEVEVAMQRSGSAPEFESALTFVRALLAFITEHAKNNIIVTLCTRIYKLESTKHFREDRPL